MTKQQELYLIVGRPNSGKTFALQYLNDAETTVYLNCDRKDLPHKCNYMVNADIHDPYDITVDGGFLDEILGNTKVTTVILDTLTDLMGLFERKYIQTAHDSRKAWGDYGTFYGSLMDRLKLISMTKTVIVCAHVNTEMNSESGSVEDDIPLSGKAKKRGAAADYTKILTAKMMSVTELDKYPNNLLTITDQDREDNCKNVFMTRPFRGDGNLSRGFNMLLERKHLYIDNNIDQLRNYIRSMYE